MRDEALTPRQVADELGVTVRTVQRWVAEGRLAGSRVGGRMRVPRSALAGVAREQRRAEPVRPIRRLLIANRGEIAARVARTARLLGIAVFGTCAPDDAPWPGQRADEIVPVASYLDGDAILAAAGRVAADAVHPGYGFLAENPEFAAAVGRAGLVWIGPPSAAIAGMGNKAAARRVAAEHRVPVLPGYDGDDQDADRLTTEARRIGFPLLIKPSAGGGGKGMRVVRSPAELPDALAAARREAGRAFGDARLILERLLDGPRHVEIQVLFDAHGTGIHLGERDCSAQRRNQKVVEEAPGPSVTPALRARMGAAALSVAGAVGYQGAGTVEFLVDDGGAFFFLEMNTRLQVEHAVTEAVTGRDLVADQLRIASGVPLDLGQRDVRLRGHAIEARLYAEDPESGFLPASGRIRHLRWPAGVRVDAGVQLGDEVSDRYDPMLAKIVAHGPTRSAALARLRAALAQTELLGVRTNLRFLRWLLDRPAVIDGEVRTDTIASVTVPATPQPDEEAWRRAAAVAVTAELVPGDTWGGGWRANAPAVVRLRHGDEERSVPVPDRSPNPSARAPVTAIDADRGSVHIDIDGQSVELRIAPPPTVEEAVRHAAAHGSGSAELTAPMPGRVIAIRSPQGAAVEAHAVVVVIEAMKMEHAVVSPLAGTVTRLAVTEGQQVQRGDLLAEVSAVG